MKLDSKYFDRIRVKPGRDRAKRERLPPCEWIGCEEPGLHKAPKGRDREGEYHRFCMTHVQQYNKSYNFFAGMPDAAVSDWLKDATTGHRPTWKLGENSANGINTGRRAKAQTRDPFGLFGEDGKPVSPGAEKRNARNAEVKALHTLGLDDAATPEMAKSQYKTLVKRLHPDANGGSRANEDTLRNVIQAYDYLRNSGFC
jgi:DnaJ domain